MIRGKEPITITTGLSTMNVILTSQVVSYIVCSIRLI